MVLDLTGDNTSSTGDSATGFKDDDVTQSAPFTRSGSVELPQPHGDLLPASSRPSIVKRALTAPENPVSPRRTSTTTTKKTTYRMSTASASPKPGKSSTASTLRASIHSVLLSNSSSHNNMDGSSSSPGPKARFSAASAFRASIQMGTMDGSSTHGGTRDGSSSSNSFAGLVNAARFSKKLIAKRMSSMGVDLSSRRGDDNLGESSTTDFSRRRRQSVVLNDPHSHLKSIITTETSPFLSQFMEYPIPAPSMARNALQLGKLLQEGEFFQLQEVVGFQTKSPQQRQHPYAIKSIKPSLFHSSLEGSSLIEASDRGDRVGAESEDEPLEKAVTKLVLEGLYLGHLQHPHILKLRGVAIGGMAADPEALFLLTDRLGDTLDQRIDTWKQWAQAKESKERKRQRRLKYPPMGPPGMGISSKDQNFGNVLSDKTIRTYPSDLIVLKTNYALQILDALQYLHERGIVVRELRPEGIGFCAYPHHHTVQLCDLSSCKEVPRDGSHIPPEQIELRPSLLDCSSHHQRGGGMDYSSTSRHGSDRDRDHSDHTESLLGVRTSVSARRYMAPEVFGATGYNTKADLYSWAMVFSELVTETKPYSSRQLMRDWTKIVVGELRPKLQKYHFPRTIKGVLELAWQANVSRRGTAKQLHKSLTTVLHMLEGQGLPWLADPQSMAEQKQLAQKQAAMAAAAGPRKRGMGMRQKTLTRQSMTLAAQPNLMKNSALRCSTTDAPLTLPQRAVHYKRLQAKDPVGWGKVWDRRKGHPDEIDGAVVLTAVQSNKEQVFQRRFKANRIEGL